VTATAYIAGTEPLSPGQRRALFAVGKRRGLSIDGLRELTPAGSISALTRAQAAGLLDRLNVGTDYEHPRPAQRQPRRPRGVYAIATDAQRRKIEALRIDLGWEQRDGRRNRIESVRRRRLGRGSIRVCVIEKRENSRVHRPPGPLGSCPQLGPSPRVQPDNLFFCLVANTLWGSPLALPDRLGGIARPFGGTRPEETVDLSRRRYPVIQPRTDV